MQVSTSSANKGEKKTSLVAETELLSKKNLNLSGSRKIVEKKTENKCLIPSHTEMLYHKRLIDIKTAVTLCTSFL